MNSTRDTIDWPVATGREISGVAILGKPITPAMLYRRVVGWEPDPDDPQRRLYRLDCGHVVSRRTRGSKRAALCEKCGQDLKRSCGETI